MAPRGAVAEQAAIVQRIERGDTSWAAVVHGTDAHSSARAFRASFARQTESVVRGPA